MITHRAVRHLLGPDLYFTARDCGVSFFFVLCCVRALGIDDAAQMIGFNISGMQTSCGRIIRI